MSRRGSMYYASLSLAACLAFGSSGCAHTAVVSQSLAEMESVRLGPDVKDGATLAPQEFAHAEAERALAREAEAHHDAAGADIYAERARVGYERAVVLARLARATTAADLARATVAAEEAAAQPLSASRVDFEKAADATAAELAVAREALTPARVGPADGPREKARRIAALSLAGEARLLCGAARLLARASTPTAPPAGTPVSIEMGRLDAAEHTEQEALASLARPAKTGATAPVEAAARARVACLDALTRTRRAMLAGSGDADALLSALSARGGWDPARDERGVIVTLRGAFKGTTLTPDADKQLRELGRVAGNRAPGPVQIVVHDANAPSKAEESADTTRAQAALGALTAGANGASFPTSVETMGAELPTADPNDAQGRARNARLEVVFVARSE